MKKYYILITSLLLLAFATADVRSFYTIPYPANALTATDYDLDGDLDILINIDGINPNFKASLYFLQNDGKGNFTFFDTIVNNIWGTRWEIYTDTIFNNEYPDIIYSNYGIYVISTDGEEFDKKSFYFGKCVDDFALGDVNGNSKLDVAFISSNDRYWGIIYNQGDTTFTEPVYYEINKVPSDIVCSDLNDDGLDDIVLGSYPCDIYFSTDTGFINHPLNHEALKVSVNDLDNDGDKDIITFSDIYVASLVYIYENKGDGVFDSVGFYRIPEGSSDFFVTDFNNDSLPDVLFLTHDYLNESMLLYYNKGNFQFGDSLIIKVKDYGEARRFMYCADLDGNGYTDIMMTRQVYDTTYAPSLLQLFFNDGKGNFVAEPPESINEVNISNKPALLCYPNPFQRNIKIEYELNNREDITIDIYNIQGQKIKTIIRQKTQPPGKYQIIWNGTDKNGKEVIYGTYLIRLQAGRQITTRTVVKLTDL